MSDGPSGAFLIDLFRGDRTVSDDYFLEIVRTKQLGLINRISVTVMTTILIAGSKGCRG